tara:strand:- start:278 stop:553 length:276 start_codon:yes stop_codon:yes gene_type:complete
MPSATLEAMDTMIVPQTGPNIAPARTVSTAPGINRSTEKTKVNPKASVPRLPWLSIHVRSLGSQDSRGRRYVEEMVNPAMVRIVAIMRGPA